MKAAYTDAKLWKKTTDRSSPSYTTATSLYHLNCTLFVHLLYEYEWAWPDPGHETLKPGPAVALGGCGMGLTIRCPLSTTLYSMQWTQAAEGRCPTQAANSQIHTSPSTMNGLSAI